MTETRSVERYIEQNEEILKEIKQLVDKKYLRVPSVIQENFRGVQEKNRNAMDALKNQRTAAREQTDSTDSLLSLTLLLNEIKDSNSKLLQCASSLEDFQELIQRHFLVSSSDYIQENRLDDLRSLGVEEFDLARLIRLCEELNSAYQNANYLSVIFLVRAILDHVPPIFDFKTFIDVSNQYGGRSVKKSLQNLQNSSRNIANAYLHEPIRTKEGLPNETQVDFRNDLDVLLGEIVRVLK